MFPLGHALLGYLLYVVFARAIPGRYPHGVRLGALLLGTQFPDLVDKPLAFAGVLVSGRSLAHSLVFTVGLLAVLWYVARRSRRSHLAVAFGFGHVSHIVGDAIGPIVTGRFGELGFLLWPVVPAREYVNDDVAPWVRVVRYYASPELTPELLLVPLAVAVFVIVEFRRRQVLSR
ncbi:metal-dependent hydrolase [Salinigranum salinum]|uniref:metal-dependent hydrolase n=1 Tax=Salinigranum salinum TaxID=1364937 RepID=UPI001F03DB9E|nr:metal-dependent hydrolase [Salinigranum salinum]